MMSSVNVGEWKPKRVVGEEFIQLTGFYIAHYNTHTQQQKHSHGTTRGGGGGGGGGSEALLWRRSRFKEADNVIFLGIAPI